MRKLFLLLVLFIGIFSIQISITNTVFAASSKQKLAVVIITKDSDYKIRANFKFNTSVFGRTTSSKHLAKIAGIKIPRPPKSIKGITSRSHVNNLKTFSDKKIQSKYQEFCNSRGFSDGVRPYDQDFIDFLSYSGYDKAIFLIVGDTNLYYGGASGYAIPNGVGGSTVIVAQNFSASTSVSAFLVDKNGIIKRANYSGTGNVANGAMYAKSFAYKKCIEEISETINPLLQ